MPDQNSSDNTASPSASAAIQKQPDSYEAIRAQARKEKSGDASTDGSPATESVLSKLMKELEAVDLASLPETEVSALAEKLRSKSLSRFGELTRDKKDLAAQLEQLKQEKDKGFTAKPKADNNPLAKIETVDALDAEFHRVSEHVKWAERQLEDNETAHPDDIIYTDAEGREYTKKAVKDSLRYSRDLKETHIPAQYQQIMTREERKLLKAQTAEKAAKELPWMQGDDNDTRRQYEALKQSVKFDAIESADPELAVQFERILAHAANSMFGKPTAASGSQVKPPAALTPPSSPNASAAAPQRANPNADRMLQEAEARYAKSQSGNDFMAVQAARRAARQQS